MMKSKIVGMVLLTLFTAALYAQQPTKVTTDTIPLKYGSHRSGNRTDKMMERWRSYGLGHGC